MWEQFLWSGHAFLADDWPKLRTWISFMGKQKPLQKPRNATKNVTTPSITLCSRETAVMWPQRYTVGRGKNSSNKSMFVLSALSFCMDIGQSLSCIKIRGVSMESTKTRWVTFCLLTYIWVYFVIFSSFSLRRVSFLREEIQKQNNSLWSRVFL